MTREIQYKIQEDNHGMGIGMFLKEKDYSRAVIITLKQNPIGIRKNGVWANVNEILETGDVLDVCLVEEEGSENIRPIKMNLDVLYEDEDILVLNKPHNTPIHPSVNNYENTLANGVTYYCHQQGIPYTFRCINRLDRDTTGVTVIAKHQMSASILSKRMKEGSLSRLYIAYVEGVTQEMGTINLPISREEGSILKRKVDTDQGKEAVTHYRRLEVLQVEGEPVSVVAFRLETGRTHQIRVHMMAIGHPLLGDFLYNENNHMLTRQALHAVACTFRHPITLENQKVIAPLPSDMAQLRQQSKQATAQEEDLMDKIQRLKW